MIEDVFNLFDTSTEGQDDAEAEGHHKSGLDQSEFAAAIKALGFTSRKHQKRARELMSKVDTDNDNLVSLEEFTNFMKGQLTGRDPDEEIGIIFSAFANDNETGRITKSRLAEVAEHFGIKLTEDELLSMFDDDVMKAEEGLQQEEFVQILKHSTWI